MTYKGPRFPDVLIEHSHLIDKGCGTNKKATFSRLSDRCLYFFLFLFLLRVLSDSNPLFFPPGGMIII